MIYIIYGLYMYSRVMIHVKPRDYRESRLCIRLFRSGFVLSLSVNNNATEKQETETVPECSRS